ncbi:MAG: tetratricopeptide repeat protein, partial [bacterium]|nr:tetratricopeptide repeat protein [bacterium]
MKQPRSIVIAIIGIMLLSVCPFLGQALGTKARIEERGKLWVVYKGQPDGVSVGMEGYLMKKTYSSQARKLVEKKIAHFRVSKVFRINSHALVDKWMENYSSKDAQWAQFTQRLVPPRGVKPKSKSKSVKKVETGKDKRWYLDKGDNAYELGKYELAMSYYDRVIEIDPDDPGAKLRTRAAQGKSFIQQGNLDYEKKDYSRAYEYYINAYQQIPGEDKFLSAERIVDLWGIEDGFFEKM